MTPSAMRAPPPALRPLPRSGRAPRLQQEQSARHAARTHRYAQVKTRFAQGQSLRQSAAACGLNTKTIRSWVRTETLPLDQRGSRGAGKLDPSISYLQTRLAEGCTNQSRLWREMQHQGFTGPRSLVSPRGSMRMASTRPWLLRRLRHSCPPPANSPGDCARPPRSGLQQTRHSRHSSSSPPTSPTCSSCQLFAQRRGVVIGGCQHAKANSCKEYTPSQRVKERKVPSTARSSPCASVLQ